MRKIILRVLHGISQRLDHFGNGHNVDIVFPLLLAQQENGTVDRVGGVD